MTKETVTFQQVVNFRNAARQYLGQKQPRTKLNYALEKMLAKTEKIQQEYSDIEQEIRIDLAETDKDGILIITEKGNYSYKKDSAKLLQKKLRETGNTTVEIDTHTVEPPKTLESAWYEFFVPFVIEDKDLIEDKKTE